MTQAERASLAYRVSATICAMAWVSSLPPLLRVSATALEYPFVGHPMPAPFSWPWLALLAVAVIPAATLVALIAPRPTVFVAHAWVWFGANVILACHASTLGSAGAYGGLWISGWHLWFAHAMRRDSDYAVTHAPVVAVLVGSTLFLPAATGKLVHGYLDGSAFLELVSDPHRAPLLRWMGVDPGDQGALVRAFSVIGVLVELVLAAGLLLPVKLALFMLGVVAVSMTLLWSTSLIPITGQMVGLAVGAGLLAAASPTAPG